MNEIVGPIYHTFASDPDIEVQGKSCLCFCTAAHHNTPNFNHGALILFGSELSFLRSHTLYIFELFGIVACISSKVTCQISIFFLNQLIQFSLFMLETYIYTVHVYNQLYKCKEDLQKPLPCCLVSFSYFNQHQMIKNICICDKLISHKCTKFNN